MKANNSFKTQEFLHICSLWYYRLLILPDDIPARLLDLGLLWFFLNFSRDFSLFVWISECYVCYFSLKLDSIFTPKSGGGGVEGEGGGEGTEDFEDMNCHL